MSSESSGMLHSSIPGSHTSPSRANRNNNAEENHFSSLEAEVSQNSSQMSHPEARNRLEKSHIAPASNRNSIFSQLPRSPDGKERAFRVRNNRDSSLHFIFDDMRESESTDDDTSITSRILHAGRTSSLRDGSESPQISNSTGEINTSGNESKFLLEVGNHDTFLKKAADITTQKNHSTGKIFSGDSSTLRNKLETSTSQHLDTSREESLALDKSRSNENNATELPEPRSLCSFPSTNSSSDTNPANEVSQTNKNTDDIAKLSLSSSNSPSREVYSTENESRADIPATNYDPHSLDKNDPSYFERDEDPSFFEKSRSVALDKSMLMNRPLVPPRPQIEERFIRSNGSPVRATEPDLSSIVDPNTSTPLQGRRSANLSISSLSQRSTAQDEPGAMNDTSASVRSLASPSSSHHRSSLLQSPISTYGEKPELGQNYSPRYYQSTSQKPTEYLSEHRRPPPKLRSTSSTPLRPVSLRLRGGLLSFDDPDDISDEDTENLDIRAPPSTRESDNYVTDNEDIGDDTRFRQRVLSIAQERRFSGMKTSQNSEHVSQDEGLRRSQAYSRKLESENMELRLKLQQYREGNATNQEFERIKKQLSLAEKRIDDLTESLERKNAVIAQLCGERDAARLKYETEIVAIVEDIERLEKSAAKYNPEAIAEIARVLPQYVSSSDGSKELVTTIQKLASQNSELGEKVQHLSSLNDELQKENATISNERSEANIKSQELTINIQKLASDSSDLKSQLDDTLDKLQSTEAQLTQCKAEMASRTSILTRLEAEIAAAEAETNLKIRKLNELHQEELISAKKRTESEVSAVKRQLELAGQEFSARISEFQARDTHQQRLLADEQAARQNIEAHASKMQDIVLESKNASYVIVREFFEELFNVMSPEFKNEVDTRIAQIVKKSAEESRSKIPLLTDLVIEYTRNLAVLAVRPASDAESSQKIWELEREIQALQATVETQWTKVGADRVLLAQLRDLKRRLKLEEEKRKSDWIEYQRVVDRQKRSSVISRQN